MMHAANTAVPQAHENPAYAIPLDEIDVSNPEMYRDNTLWGYFERLRRKTPCITAPRACSVLTGQ